MNIEDTLVAEAPMDVHTRKLEQDTLLYSGWSAEMAAEGVPADLEPDWVIPDDWVTGLVCNGDGCRDCDECGQVHPDRQEFLEEVDHGIREPSRLLETMWLGDNALPHRGPRIYEWAAAQQEPAMEIMQRGADGDGHADDISRYDVSRQDPDATDA